MMCLFFFFLIKGSVRGRKHSRMYWFILYLSVMLFLSHIYAHACHSTHMHSVYIHTYRDVFVRQVFGEDLAGEVYGRTDRRLVRGVYQFCLHS